LLLGSLYLSDVCVDGDDPAFRRLALVDLKPTPLAAALDVGLPGLPVL
jgi:hypothetical protein